MYLLTSPYISNRVFTVSASNEDEAIRLVTELVEKEGGTFPGWDYWNQGWCWDVILITGDPQGVWV